MFDTTLMQWYNGVRKKERTMAKQKIEKLINQYNKKHGKELLKLTHYGKFLVLKDYTEGAKNIVAIWEQKYIEKYLKEKYGF